MFGTVLLIAISQLYADPMSPLLGQDARWKAVRRASVVAVVVAGFAALQWRLGRP